MIHSMDSFSRFEQEIRVKQAHKLQSIRSRYDVDDLVQDTAVFMLKYDKQVHERFSCYAASVLATGARRHETAAMRSPKREKMCIDVCGDGVGYDPQSRGNDDPFELVAMKDEMARMNSALNNIPSNLAESVRLRYFEGLLVREIADRLGVTENTVDTRIRRGIKKLKELLVD